MPNELLSLDLFFIKLATKGSVKLVSGNYVP